MEVPTKKEQMTHHAFCGTSPTSEIHSIIVRSEILHYFKLTLIRSKAIVMCL